MKIAVVGLGAVGGLDRGAAGACRLRRFARWRAAPPWRRCASTACGSTLDGVDGSRRLRVSDDAAALGPQDLVVIALKGPALIEAAPALAAAAAPGKRSSLPAMNGVPWWFLQTGYPGGAPMRELAAPLESVDPGGAHRRCPSARAGSSAAWFT